MLNIRSDPAMEGKNDERHKEFAETSRHLQIAHWIESHYIRTANPKNISERKM